MNTVAATGKHGQLDITVDVQTSDTSDTIHLVTITANGKREMYWVEPIPSDFGTACTFLKLGTSDRHEVNLGADGLHECDCKGMARYNRCRHVATALILLDAGLLRPSPRPEHAAEVPARQVSPACFNCHKPYAECSCTI
ncbi:MAG TPA: hypothetical protein VH682_24665 [Gemmataceae bacterium]|jgi:hypothetical protein